MNDSVIFFQLFEHESSTYTYILGDKLSGEVLIIDPVAQTLERDLKLLEESSLKLKYILETHVHADHVTSSGKLRERTGAQVCVGEANGVSCADIQLTDGQELMVGNIKVTAIATPGHTSGCMCFIAGDRVFTGDTLLIRGCGRTDFQSGSSSQLFDSVRERLFCLPDDTMIYPGHDYKGFTMSTIGLEKKHNPRLNLGVGKEDFRKIMEGLNLAYPKKIDVALPANKVCGLV